MNQKDQMKLLDAGFTIIRSEVIQNDVVIFSYSKKIKARTKARPNWHTYEEGFKTSVSLHRRMSELLMDRMIVEV